MKIITDREYGELAEAIIKQEKKQAEKSNRSFEGFTGEALYQAMVNYFGGEFKVITEQQVKFTRGDINAVASARYFRKGGVTLLMGVVILLLVLAIIIKSVVVMTPLYYNIYYTLCGAIALSFIFLYSRGQAKARKELWRQLGREEKLEK